MFPVRLYTTRIPHHSSHSGYEQLVRYMRDGTVFAASRINDRKGWKRQTERILRRLAANRWYMWDGIVSEWDVLKNDRKTPSICHFLYGDHTIGLLPHVRRNLKSPLILTIHACPADLPEILQFPKMLQKVDHFILLGSNQEAFFRKAGIPNHRISVVPHGVDTSFFKPGALPEKRGKTVLMVGNWRRNFPLYREVIEKMPDTQFRIVTASYNVNWFDGLDESRVVCLTGISDAQLLKEYQSADAMLLSMTDAVANNVLLEAMACGLPVVTENMGAVPEYTGADYPYFFGNKEVESAIDTIRRVLAEKPEPEFFTRIASAFDWKKVAAQTRHVYEQITPLY